MQLAGRTVAEWLFGVGEVATWAEDGAIRIGEVPLIGRVAGSGRVLQQRVRLPICSQAMWTVAGSIDGTTISAQYVGLEGLK